MKADQRYYVGGEMDLIRSVCVSRLRKTCFLILVYFAGMVLAPSLLACQGQDGGRSIVVDISAGETLILEDGRAVRLMGILGPKPGRNGVSSAARGQMETALSKLTLGKAVVLHLGGRQRDRYGRILAHVMVEAGADAPVWVQSALVSSGLARVISFRDNRLCTQELLAAEERARVGQAGLWKTGYFAIRSALAEDVLYRLSRNYEIVEGHVSNVAEIRGKTYINFGQNWRRDFTAFIPSRSLDLFRNGDAGRGERASLAELNGKYIRVRGWLKNYNGPSITVTHPEQIEVIDKPSAVIR